MLSIPLQNASDCKVTVTSTATGVYDLMDTASSVNNSQKYYDQKFAGCVSIQTEDGDIRYLIGTDPTATEGHLVKNGQKEYLPGVEVGEVRLIRVGSSDVKCTVVPWRGEPGDSPMLMTGEVVLETGDIQIGAVEIKDGDTDTRLDVKVDGVKYAAYVQSESLASASNQTDGSQKTQVVDSSGNAIDAEADHAGKYHLAVTVNQDVNDDANNSSTSNLASGATFTGTATSTLGVVGLQWSLKTDQNCTVYIEESPDGTNWDISYPFDYIASKGGRGETVQASQAYWRIRVTNEGDSTTSYFRLQAVLCPVATSLPSELSSDGRLKSQSTISGRENTDRHVWVNPTNELAISPVYRLVGTAFDGTTKDPNFWTETVVNGSVTQAGDAVTLLTSAAINSSAKYVSVRKARFVPGSSPLFTAGLAMTVAPEAGNTRRVGCYTDTDGFFMQVAGTTFSVGSRKSSSDTLVSTGSFNGNYGSSWSPELDTYYKVQIEFTPLVVIWYIDGVRLHSIKSAGLSNTLTLPIALENINTTCSTDMDLICVGAYIARQGELFTNPTSKLVTGESETVLKYGAGTLKGCVISAIVNGADINIYDGTSTGGILIWASGNLAAKTEPFNIDFYGLPFSDGLTLEIADSSAAVLTVYE